ncbi:MAG TPA: hypothetical protein PKA00_03600 [Saprospiraceae bacterium]|nr:hypothetical protein [Saprospiraceae bacterium]HMQ81962.1 hypothetical protein [Saprospiraceae bacterium]
MQKYIYTLLLCLGFSLASGQGNQVQFGKNRVQYHRDFAEWSEYESDNFISYWYGESRTIGQSVVLLAEYDFNAIQNLLEHRINEKIQIIVYTDLTDLKQSNIGSEETFNNLAGQTKIVGNKVFVYFTGDHNELRKQIREGIASVYLNAMLFGSNLQEIVQNAVMMNLPEWFKEGLVAYVGQKWSTEMDNQLRDYILSEAVFEGFEGLAERNPKLAGHSLWYYISENYGSSTVSNLLYLTRINRSIESGFLYVLGSPYEIVAENWATFFKERYLLEGTDKSKHEEGQLGFKNKRQLPVTQVKLSPDGKKLVYVFNEIGRYKVYLHDLVTDERRVLFKYGFRNAFQATDYNYPLLAWNPNGQQLALLYERRDVVKLTLYDLTTKKEKTEDLSSEYQRVYSMEFINPISMVFSASVWGQSDIFVYYTNTRQTQRITGDFWDDLDATFVNIDNIRGILFASNRQDSALNNLKLDTILPINTFDLFFYDLENKDKELVRITHTPYANERQPAAIDNHWFSYLSDRYGIYNRETGYLEDYIHHYDQIIYLNDDTEIRLHADSVLTELDTAMIDSIVIDPIYKKRAVTQLNSNYDKSILTQSTAPRVNKTADLVLQDGEHRIFIRALDPEISLTSKNTIFQQKNSKAKKTGLLSPVLPESPKTTVLEKAEEKQVTVIELPKAKQDTGKIDIDNYLFQSEFDDEEEVPATVIIKDKPQNEKTEDPLRIATPNSPYFSPYSNNNTTASNPIKNGVYPFRPGKIIPYRLQFRTDYVTTQLDNSLLFDGLELYGANPNGFSYPPLGILLKTNFKDLLEDYEFEGGVRIPTTFNGSEYFLIYRDKKRRLDKQYAVYMKNQRYAGQSLTIAPNRREVNIVLGQYSLRYPLDIFRSIRTTATLRRDRITQLSTDLPTFQVPSTSEERVGLKMEYVFDNTLDVALNIKNGARYKIYAEAVKLFDLQLNDGVKLNFNEGFMGVVGFDARYYQRLLKHSVLAIRGAGATSFGSEKMAYYLGDVDNPLVSNFNGGIPIPQNLDDFAFQTIATNMRGFRLNIRNGNSYALVNTELRAPIFKYLFRHIRSPFFRNFQLVGFFDVGTAWEGLDPFSKENPLNTIIIDEGQVIVKVNYFRDPIVAGYGAGARVLLFGYLLRVDYAWGLETRIVQDPIWHVSLGMDF